MAEGFRRLDLGQLIGTRTWGGEIWLTSSNRLVDWGEHLQELIRNDPRPVPPVPAFPDKSFRYPQRAADENGGG